MCQFKPACAPAVLKQAIAHQADSSTSEGSDSMPIPDPDASGMVQCVSGNEFQVVDEISPEERPPRDRGTRPGLAKAMHVKYVDRRTASE
jgi:hypothetical protein